MDESFKQVFETELRHLKSHADEFARDQRYSRLAEKIGLSPGAKLHDPFIDWLLQGYAFLAARVRTKLDEEFPRFTQNLLSVVHPHLIAPTPSMIVAEFKVKPAQDWQKGKNVSVGTQLTLPTKPPGKGQRRERNVIFTTGRDVRLLPVKVTNAQYLPDATSLQSAGASRSGPAGVMVDVSLTVDESCQNLEVDEIDLFVTNDDQNGARLFEALGLSDPYVEVVNITDGKRRRGPAQLGTRVQCRPLGFERNIGVNTGSDGEDLLLPYDRRSFDGYRLLHEFFALPARFHFLRLSGLKAALAGHGGKDFRVIFILNKPYEKLVDRVRATDVRPNCVPAVNLFPHSADTINMKFRSVENEIQPDRGEPTRYEVHSVTSVVGRSKSGQDQVFKPFFSSSGLGVASSENARFYALNRRPRSVPEIRDERDQGLDEYRGTEVAISLVDEAARPLSEDLRTLSIDLLCTNRHLPIYAREARGEDAKLSADAEYGTEAIQIVAGPSMPRAGLPEGRRLWDAVSHLSLNYLSLIDSEDDDSAAALRQLMRLYAPQRDLAAQSAIDSLRRVSSEPTVSRMKAHGGGIVPPVTFVRGIEVSMYFDDKFDNVSTLSAILERFLSGYSSVNNFTALVMRDLDGLERLRWRPRAGSRTLL